MYAAHQAQSGLSVFLAYCICILLGIDHKASVPHQISTMATATTTTTKAVPSKTTLIATKEGQSSTTPPETKRGMVAEGCEASQQWHKDLVENGFAIVKGAIPRERADRYAEEMYEWLESLYACWHLMLRDRSTNAQKVTWVLTGRTLRQSTRTTCPPSPRRECVSTMQ